MIIRRRSKRPLIIIGIVVAVLVVAAGGAYAFRKHQVRAKYLRMREDGLKAYAAGDYVAAINQLYPYYRRDPGDANVIYHLAEARRRVEAPEGKHLQETLTLYRRFLELAPHRLDVRRDQMLLFARFGQNTEAIDAADKLLGGIPDDPMALRIKAASLVALRRDKEAMEVAERAVKREPLDVEMQLLLVQLYHETGRKGEILPHGMALLSAHRGDGRAELVLGLACLLVEKPGDGELAKLRELFKECYPQPDAAGAAADKIGLFLVMSAANRPMDDLGLARSLVLQLDRMAMPAATLGVLERAVQKHDDPELRAMLVVRSFEAARYADLEKLTAAETLKPDGGGVQLMAFRAIALAQTGKKDQAKAIVDPLAARKDDRVAQAWATIVREFFLAESPDHREVVAAAQAGLDVQRRNPYLLAFLGDANLSLGERESARQAYVQAMTSAPLWAIPPLRLSEILLAEGQGRPALEAARLAARLLPATSTLVNLANVWSSTVDVGKLHQEAKLVELLAEIQQRVPGEPQTLPLHVAVLAQSGQREQAVALIRSALDPKAKPPEGTLLRLGLVSRLNKLGLEDECERRSEQLHGVTPLLAVSRAQRLRDEGKVPESLRLLEEHMQRAPQPPGLEWRLAWAQFLDESRDARAADAVRKLGDDPALAGDLRVQRFVLGAATVQEDRAFLGRAVERIRALTGEKATGWRLARARVLARADSGKAELEEAAKLLGELVASAPDALEVRQLLGLVQQRLGNAAAAAEHFEAALRLKPDSSTILLNLALLYQSQEQFSRARERIDLVKSEELNDSQRRQLVALLAEQGQAARALAVAEGGTAPATANEKLMLAALYRQQNKPQKAEPLFRELLKEPTAPVIAGAARFFAATDRPEEAEKALALLDGVKLDAGQADLVRADYYIAVGDLERALKRAAAATKAAPANPSAWRLLIALRLRAGAVDQAIAVATEASRALPDDVGLRMIVERQAAVRLLAANPMTSQVVPIVLRDPENAAIAWDALGVAIKAIEQKQPPEVVAEALRPIAERAPHMEPLQTLLVQALLSAKKPAEALEVAQRTMAAAPASPEAVQLVARVHAATGEWTQVLALASRWREMTLENPIPADLMIAEVRVRLGQFAAAEKQLAPYLASARSRPAAYLPVLAQQARILVADNRAQAAADLLWPAAEKLPAYRRLWMDMALSQSAAPQAEAWLKRIAGAIPADATREQVDLANAWHALGQRHGENRYTKEARAYLAPLAARPEATAELVFTHGFLAASDRDFAEAEKAYRRVLAMSPPSTAPANNLAMSPNYTAAANNLAMVLVEQKANLDEAAALMGKVIAAEPQVSAYYDTLSQVHAARKDYAQAAAMLRKAIEVDPLQLKWYISLASTHADAGQKDEAMKALAQLKKRWPDDAKLPDEQRDRLTRLRLRLGM